jgi:hypothetical protein
MHNNKHFIYIFKLKVTGWELQLPSSHVPDRQKKEREKKKEGKAVPLQAWSGPKGSRKLRFPDFLTTAQDDCKVVSLTHRPHGLNNARYCRYSDMSS